jgi:membrane protease YdiL (CAAX protease family)
LSATPSYRALSWVSIFGIVGFLSWITVVPNGFPGAPVAALLVFVLAVAALKFGVREPIDYWRAISEPPQAPRVAFMVIATIVVQLIAAAIIVALNHLTAFSSIILAIVIWVGVPCAFLVSGLVKWPKRQSFPPLAEFLTVTAVAILITGILCLLASTPSEGHSRMLPSMRSAAIDGSTILALATMEEVVFRVLLLTALVEATRSRTHALILSSVFFAVCHIPINLEQPIVAMDLQ